MVEHLVLFKLKEDTTAEQKLRVVDTLKELAGIEGIEEMSVGLNHSSEGKDKGFHVGMRVLFRDQAALDAYLPSEPHVTTVGKVKALFDDVIVIDYSI